MVNPNQRPHLYVKLGPPTIRAHDSTCMKFWASRIFDQRWCSVTLNNLKNLFETHFSLSHIYIYMRFPLFPPIIIITQTLTMSHNTSIRDHNYRDKRRQVPQNMAHLCGRKLPNTQCICLTRVLQVFIFWHAKTCTKFKCTSIDTHVLEVDTYCDLWRK